MRILIAEDEPVSARKLAEVTRKILGNRILSLHFEKNFKSILSYLETNEIDLLFLDLTLTDKNEFEILQNISSKKFSTIIVSSHTERAIEAFQYEVVDFVSKPFDEERLVLALYRFAAQTNKQTNKQTNNYLFPRKEKLLF